MPMRNPVEDERNVQKARDQKQQCYCCGNVGDSPVERHYVEHDLVVTVREQVMWRERAWLGGTTGLVESVRAPDMAIDTVAM